MNKWMGFGRVLSIAFMIVLAQAAYGGGYSGGAGTPTAPYQIGGIADWMTLCGTPEDWNKCFRLIADINLSGVSITPVGTNLVPFTGVFNGDGHLLRNVLISLPEGNNVGLFGFLNPGAELQGLGVETVSITGRECAGGLVGWNNGGTIISCRVTGTVMGSLGGFSTGGLVGRHDLGLIAGCHTSVTVNGIVDIGGLVGVNIGGTIRKCFALGPVSGNEDIGGLVGYQSGGETALSYARGIVTGNRIVGGLIGSNYQGVLTCCYAAGPVSGSESVGGLAAGCGDAVVTACYWDMDVSTVNTSACGEGRGTDAMTHPYGADTYTGWDFDVDWNDDAGYTINNGYPYLREEVLHPGDLNYDWRMVMGEAIGYLAGWQNGDNPLAYAIRAAYLWQNGEAYSYDPGEETPTCWILDTP